MPSRTNCRVSDGRLMALNYVLNFRKLGILAQQLWPFLTAFWNCWRFFARNTASKRCKAHRRRLARAFFYVCFPGSALFGFSFRFSRFASFSLLNDGDIPFRKFSSKGLPHLWWAFNEQQKGKKNLVYPTTRRQPISTLENNNDAFLPLRSYKSTFPAPVSTEKISTFQSVFGQNKCVSARINECISARMGTATGTRIFSFRRLFQPMEWIASANGAVTARAHQAAAPARWCKRSASRRRQRTVDSSATLPMARHAMHGAVLADVVCVSFACVFAFITVCIVLFCFCLLVPSCLIWLPIFFFTVFGERTCKQASN